jgi:ABC-type polysaccharide/polyol phosphate transport system ATPase subunit
VSTAPENGVPAISVDDVSKRFRLYHEKNQSLKATVMRGRRARYDEFWALKDVSFDIPKGSTFGLIGENGSGKSTLLKCMARILRPDHGDITVRGRVSALLELGAGFHPELSGRENVYLNGAILGMKKKHVQDRFDDIVAFAGLEQFIDSPVKNYSSGMYLRLGFSVAINVDPDVLLIDEILAVGDAEFQKRCNEKLSELQEKGTTIVIVSHALESLRNLCHGAALLEHGKLINVGNPPDIVDEYLDRAHPDRVHDGVHGTRGGSGEARIEDVEVLGAHGEPLDNVRTGDSLVFRLHYEVDEPIEKPVFGFSITRLDGVLVSGTNTREHEVYPEKIDGRGYVDLVVDRFLALPGIYDMSVSLSNHTLTHTYDDRYRRFRFEVEHGHPNEHTGLVSLGGDWDLRDDRPGATSA